MYIFCKQSKQLLKIITVCYANNLSLSYLYANNLMCIILQKKKIHCFLKSQSMKI